MAKAGILCGAWALLCSLLSSDGSLAAPLKLASNHLCPILYTDAAQARYNPGQDVEGNPVKGADIAPSLTLEIDRIIVPIRVDLSDLGGGHAALLEEALIGVVSLSNDQVYYNGQPLAGDPLAGCASMAKAKNPRPRK